jgi:hypothetical protein
MITRWLFVVYLCLAVGMTTPAFAQGGGFFTLASAYPCAIQSYDPADGITSLQTFAGFCPPEAALRGAAPGILSLQQRDGILDVNCFALVPFGQEGPCVVQSYRLTKQVPGSYKCPDVYGFFLQRYLQFGAGVRTWWSLNFTQPGTLFILQVDSACQVPPVPPSTRGGVRVHRDTWTWQVVTDIDTLGYTIELMHGGAISTLEVPCILAEDVYDALRAAHARLADALLLTDEESRRRIISNAIFDFEALIIGNCLFVDALNPGMVYPGPDQFGQPNFQPPGNLAQTVAVPNAGTMVAGIVDSIEHPCCCKLLVDLEYIAVQNRVGVAPYGGQF